MACASQLDADTNATGKARKLRTPSFASTNSTAGSHPPLCPWPEDPPPESIVALTFIRRTCRLAARPARRRRVRELTAAASIPGENSSVARIFADVVTVMYRARRFPRDSF